MRTFPEIAVLTEHSVNSAPPPAVALATPEHDEAVVVDARFLVDRIAPALPDGALRQRFLAGEPVARILS